MSWFMAAIYDRFMSEVETHSFGPWRSELLADVAGDVLEVGAGTGVNLPHYPSQVERLWLSEPDRDMRAKLEQRLRHTQRPFETELLSASLEQLPLPGESVDVAVCTLVLCSVPSPKQALREMFRVLRRGGRLVFLEHVAAPHNPSVHAWQRRVEPLWKRAAGNCHLTRDTRGEIVEAGFELSGDVRERARKALPIVKSTVRGVARKPL